MCGCGGIGRRTTLKTWRSVIDTRKSSTLFARTNFIAAGRNAYGTPLEGVARKRLWVQVPPWLPILLTANSTARVFALQAKSYRFESYAVNHLWKYGPMNRAAAFEAARCGFESCYFLHFVNGE